MNHFSAKFQPLKANKANKTPVITCWHVSIQIIIIDSKERKKIGQNIVLTVFPLKEQQCFLCWVCKFQAWLLSISEAVLSPRCPRCPASQRRYAETQHIKWDVTCTATLFYLYCARQHWGRNAKKRSPAAWWGLVALQAHRGDSVIFALRAEGGRETSPLNQYRLCAARISPRGKERKNCR